MPADLPSLLPCPFCGDEAELTSGTPAGWAAEPRVLWAASCKSNIDPDCFGGAEPRYFSPEFAIAAWNRRAYGEACRGEDGAMAKIGALIVSQDNRVTDAPIFIVQQKREHPAHDDYDYDRIAAELRRVEWRPIESAPRDGERVLIFDNGHPYVSRFWCGQWHVGSLPGTPAYPTHWQPLPAPPTGASEQAQPIARATGAGGGEG